MTTQGLTEEEPAASTDAAAAVASVRKRPKPGERRVQILQALATMLEQPGADRITTAALAAHLSVSEAALYRHFASKAQMFEGLIEFIEQSLIGESYMRYFRKACADLGIAIVIEEWPSAEQLASVGAGVMHSRSIEFAKKYDVPIRVRSSFSDTRGTMIRCLSRSGSRPRETSSTSASTRSPRGWRGTGPRPWAARSGISCTRRPPGKPTNSFYAAWKPRDAP